MTQTIFHIIPRYYTGGAEHLVLDYASRLDGGRFKVYVASCVDDGELLDAFSKTSATLFVGAKSRQGSRLAIWRELKKYIADKKPDIIHTHLFSADIVGYFLKKAFPHIYWISTQHNVEYNRPYIYRMIWEYVLKKADRVIAVSPAVADFAKEIFHILEDRLEMIQNGIDIARWKDIDGTSLFYTTPYQLACIGRLEEQKGHRFLLLALGELKKYKWELHLFGDGSLRKHLSLLADKLSIGDRVHFHGNVDDLPERMKHIDLVIQPSLWEGMSLTVMEAMTAGRPVLASEQSAEGIIVAGDTGYVVPARDKDMLRKELLDIFSNPDEARRIARRARAEALYRFDIQKNIEQISILYEHKHGL